MCVEVVPRKVNTITILCISTTVTANACGFSVDCANEHTLEFDLRAHIQHKNDICSHQRQWDSQSVLIEMVCVVITIYYYLSNDTLPKFQNSHFALARFVDDREQKKKEINCFCCFH